MTEITKEETYLAAVKAVGRTWAEHEQALEDWNRGGGVIGSKAGCKVGITYGLYTKASTAMSKASRALGSLALR